MNTTRNFGNTFKKYIDTTLHNGVTFYDFDPLIAHPETFNEAMDALSNLIRPYKPTFALIVDSRGFAIGPLVCQKLGIGMNMIRKAGKTPGEVITKEYSIEYSEANRVVELKKNLAIQRDLSRVVIIDDIIATGGTTAAIENLVEQLGGKVVCHAFLININGIRRTKLNAPVVSLMNYELGETGYPKDIENMLQPLRYPISSLSFDNIEEQTVLLYCKSMESIACRLQKRYPTIFQLKEVKWNKFPDGYPNISFDADLVGRNVCFLGSMHDIQRLILQMMVIFVLPRQDVKSLTIILPYFAPGTMERVDTEGVLATAEPLAKFLSCLPHTNTGPAKLVIYDIHALQERFYFSDNIRLRLRSAVPLFLRHLGRDPKRLDNIVIVFPDDGASKRYSSAFSKFKQIVCSKVRKGDNRYVTIKDVSVDPDEVKNKDYEAFIVDDLVQSGGTLCECREVLKGYGFRRISAFVTHAVFPNMSYLDLIPGGKREGFHRFYVTDSVPEVAYKLPYPFFQVISIIDDIAEYLVPENILLSSVYNEYPYILASSSVVKIMALQRFGSNIRRINAESGVPPQPFGLDQIRQGCENRLRYAQRECKCGEGVVYVSIENGIIVGDDGKYYDQACVMIQRGDKLVTVFSDIVPVPDNAFERSKNSNFQKTAGEFIDPENPSDWFTQVGYRSRVNVLCDALQHALDRL